MCKPLLPSMGTCFRTSGVPFRGESFVVEQTSGEGRVGRVEGGSFETVGLVIGAQTELITETLVLRERGMVGCEGCEVGVEAASVRPVCVCVCVCVCVHM